MFNFDELKTNVDSEALLNFRISNPDFLAVSGSRLYGTNRENSDYDYRGFFVPPFEYLIGSKGFTDPRDVPGADHKVYSLGRYMELTMKGDPQCTELLFVPEEQVLKQTEIGKTIREAKKFFLSNKIYRRVMGYGYSEWRKAMGERLEIEDRTLTEDEVIMDIRNVFKPDKDEIDTVIDILMSKKKKRTVSSLNNLGAKRKAEFDKYGFGTSSAAHAIRLSGELKELLLTGNITFPRPDAPLLKKIRYGEYSKEEVKEIYEAKVKEAEEAFPKSILPNQPDQVKLDDLYVFLVKKALKSDDTFSNG